MNALLKCDFILSKKLQKIVEQGEPVFLQINSVKGNRGSGWIRIWSDSLPNIEEIGETSIMFTPTELLEDIPEISEDTPAVQALFQGSGIEAQPQNSPVAKIAMTDPDGESKKYSSPWASKTRLDGPRTAVPPKIQTSSRSLPPEVPSSGLQAPLSDMPSNSSKVSEESHIPEPPASVQSYDQLMSEIDDLGKIDSVRQSKTKGGPRVGREAAIEMENKKELVPRIKKPVYVVNLRGGAIEIADMEFTIFNEEVVDLSRIEAQKLRDSRDFKWCLDNGILGFTNRNKFMDFLENRDSMLDANDRGLTAYSGPPGEAADRAAENMYDGFDDPLVDNVSSTRSGHRNIKRSSEVSSRSRRDGHVEMSEDEDILDLSSHDDYDDLDNTEMNSLVSSMDSGGMPSNNNFNNSLPLNRGSKSISRGSTRKSSGPKSIKKV